MKDIVSGEPFFFGRNFVKLESKKEITFFRKKLNFI